jgi:hypothetical protein
MFARGGAGGIRALGTNVFNVVIARGGVRYVLG